MLTVRFFREIETFRVQKYKIPERVRLLPSSADPAKHSALRSSRGTFSKRKSQSVQNVQNIVGVIVDIDVGVLGWVRC